MAKRATPRRKQTKPTAVEPKPARPKGGLMRNAPAQETIYTIRAICPVPADLDQVREPLRRALADQFPHAEDFNAFQTTIHHPATEAPVMNTEKRVMGFRFKSAGGGHVAHFMLDGLVVNWLKAEYRGFEASIAALARYWQLYMEHFQPVAVDHVALRYINQLHLPMEQGRSLRLSDYIKNGPGLPKIAGLTFAGFQQYMELVKQPEGLRSRVMTATLNAENGLLPLLFDYEAFASLDGSSRREPLAIWESFRKVHDWCDTFFNQTLTDRCRSHFS